jgi:FKBP-type peptidyl-prolyl cis-trans isomerase FkpA
MKSYLIAISLAAGLQALAQAPGAATRPAGPGGPGATPPPTTVPPEISAKFKNAEERNGYVLGSMIAEDMVTRIRRMGYDAPDEAIARGFTEWVTGKPALSKEEVRKVFTVMQGEVNKKNDEKKKAEAEKNQKEGEAFLAANKTKEGVVTTASGLQYKVVKQGDGKAKPAADDTVICHYKGTLLDGKEFDSSYTRGEPARFALNRVIKGWTEGVQLMTVGSKYTFFIPAGLAYGTNGSPPRIPGNATLNFDIELVGIQPKTAEANAGQPAVTSDIIKVPSKSDLEKGAKIEVIKSTDLERLKQEKAGQPQAPKKDK